MYIGSDSSTSTVTRVMAKGTQVYGVTSLGDEVFVARENCQQKIEVYDANTLALQRHIKVPWIGDYLSGLAACSHNNCLYASDYDNDNIHRVDLSGSNAVMKWSVARGPVGLSVNNEHNLVVVSQDERKLLIFTTRGTLLQDIVLAYRRTCMGTPSHAVQLSTGTLLCSTMAAHDGCVSLVGVDGNDVRSSRRMRPKGLAVDREGRVLVADKGKHRLLVLDQSLSIAGDMSVNVMGGLCGPYSLWYDRSRRRLYIGEWSGGRVIVIDNLKDFSMVAGTM